MSGPITNATENGARTARDVFGDTKDSIGEASEAVRKAARDTLKDAKDVGRKGAEKAYSAAEDTARSLFGYVNERPVQAALIGIGGLVLASLLFRRR